MLMKAVTVVNGNGLEKPINEVPKVIDSQQAAIPTLDNKIISVIIRCHKKERLSFLEEAIFSLSTQNWTEIEIVVVIQNGDEDFESRVRDLVEHQPWYKNPAVQIHSVKIPAGVDGRSSLLNLGIKKSIGRYLAFLDDDDVVYQHGYEVLIGQLIAGNGAVAVGGCRTAKTSQEADHWYINTKETPFTGGRNRYDLFRDNFIPIHSYVIDRQRIDLGDLYFDDAFPPLEDYDFLLRIASKYEFDFSQLDVFVCEYRIHDSNSIPYTAQASTNQIAKHRRAQKLIAERKNTILCLVPLQELVATVQQQIHQPPVNSALPAEIQNSRILEKTLVGISNKIYSFFGNYPQVEQRLSRTANYWWNIYHRRKISKSEEKPSQK